MAEQLLLLPSDQCNRPGEEDVSTTNDQAPQEPITDYEMGSDNIRPFGLDIHNPVFVVSAGVIIAFVVVALSFQKETAEFFGWLRLFLTKER